MTDPEPSSALRKHPEIAKQIGVLMEHFAGLEDRMFIVYAALATRPVISANDVEQRFSEFYKLRSVNLRSGLVLSAAKSVLDDLRYKALVRLWRRFKAAANRRTDVAHCVFMFMNSQGLSRLSTSGPKP